MSSLFCNIFVHARKLRKNFNRTPKVFQKQQSVQTLITFFVCRIFDIFSNDWKKLGYRKRFWSVDQLFITKVPLIQSTCFDAVTLHHLHPVLQVLGHKTWRYLPLPGATGNGVVSWASCDFLRFSNWSIPIPWWLWDPGLLVWRAIDSCSPRPCCRWRCGARWPGCATKCCLRNPATAIKCSRGSYTYLHPATFTFREKSHFIYWTDILLWT